MEKFKIGIECEELEKGGSWGIGRIVSKLLEEISQRPEIENKLRFVLFFKDRVPEMPYLNTPIFEKKIIAPFLRGRLFPIYYLVLLPLRLWFTRVDLMFWPAYMLPFFTLTKSLAIMTEDIYHEAFKGSLPFRYRFFYAIWGTYSAKRATKLVAISESSKKEVARLFKINPERIVVNHLGIDISDKQQETRDKEDNLVASRLSHGHYFLYVGQAFPRRHLKETLEAFEMIAPDFPNLQLIAIGPDKYETPIIKDMVRKINEKLGREAVIHKDYVPDDDLVSYYKSAKGLVYISNREAFGLPPMEALAYGVPSIVKDTPLTHELFGENAFFVKNPTPDEVAVQMRELLTNNAKIEKIKKSAPQIVSNYTWKKFTDRWLEIILKIIS